MNTVLGVLVVVVAFVVFFGGGYLLERKNRSAAPRTKAQEAAEREWFHAMR